MNYNDIVSSQPEVMHSNPPLRVVRVLHRLIASRCLRKEHCVRARTCDRYLALRIRRSGCGIHYQLRLSPWLTPSPYIKTLLSLSEGDLTYAEQ